MKKDISSLFNGFTLFLSACFHCNFYQLSLSCGENNKSANPGDRFTVDYILFSQFVPLLLFSYTIESYKLPLCSQRMSSEVARSVQAFGRKVGTFFL